MPTYVYECLRCQDTFEVRASIGEKAAGLAPTCPRCGAKSARQLLTGAFVIGSSRGLDPIRRSACGPGGPGGCCG